MTTQQYKRPDTSTPVEGESGLPNRTKFQDKSATIPRIPISSEDHDSEHNYIIDSLNELFDLNISGIVPDGSVTIPKLANQLEGEVISFGSGGVPEIVTAGSTGQVLTANASGAPSFQSATTVPTATLLPFAASSVPTGYLLCDGSEVSRATYADLFSAISTTYGVGDGSTTFNLPDMRGRGALGMDNMGGVSADRVTDSSADVLGGTGGAEGTTSTTEGHALTSAEMTHKHETPVNNAASIALSDIFGRGSTVFSANAEGGSGGTTASGGMLTNTPESVSSSAHDHDLDQQNIIDPYVAMNYIIKT